MYLFVLNDNSAEIDMQGVQFIRCVMCHFIEKNSSLQSSTKFRKGFVTYSPKHGITSMEKHVANEHSLDLQKFLLHNENSYVE